MPFAAAAACLGHLPQAWSVREERLLDMVDTLSGRLADMTTSVAAAAAAPVQPPPSAAAPQQPPTAEPEKLKGASELLRGSLSRCSGGAGSWT